MLPMLPRVPSRALCPSRRPGPAGGGPADAADAAESPEPGAVPEPDAEPGAVPEPDAVESPAASAGEDAAEPEPEADGQAGADPVAEFKSELRRLPGDWYVVHSYAGYENRVRTNLESRTQSLNMED